MSKYLKNEKAKAPKKNCFNNDKFNGFYKKRKRAFVLSNWKNNFFNGILSDVTTYFNENGISWWGGRIPTGHILSSQIACLNFLFSIRNQKDIVLSIAKIISSEFVDVQLIESDINRTKGFIAFEVVSGQDHLNECGKDHKPTRGNNCTSIDALILAKHINGKNILIPIEWKYTESYGNTDKSIEDGKDHEKGSQESGKTRLDRYSKLINISNQLKSKEKYKNSIYFFEPFYQLMRQTLWAEQMILNKNDESICADDFIHVHVVPNNNHDLLKNDLESNKRRKGYLNEGKRDNMENTWKSCLKNIKKYKIIDPRELLPVINNKDLVKYLSERYIKE